MNGERLLLQVRRAIQQDGLRGMILPVRAVLPHFRSFDAFFWAACQYGMIAHIDAQASEIRLERP